MAFLDQAELAVTTTFQNRVRHAMVKVAIAIQAEDGATLNHANRSSYARAVLNDPNRHAPLFAQGVVTNATITAASSDGDIEFTVISIWDAYAGVL